MSNNLDIYRNLSTSPNEQTEKIRRNSLISELDTREEEREIKIHEWLTYDQIEQIKDYIENHPNKHLNYNELYELFGKLNIQLTNDEYKTLFLKINHSRDDIVSWNEVCDFLIYLFQQDDPFSQKEALSLPITGDPIIKISKHKTPIISISILESLISEDSDEDIKGTYVTASKDGQINFWTSDFETNKKGISKSHYLKITPTWVLGITALSDVRIVCVTSTERELRFYDITATNFSLRLVIRSMPYAVCAMYYSFFANGDQDSRLVMGDLGGNVRVLSYSPELRGPFQSKAGATVIELTWNEILKGRFTLLKAREYKNVFIEYIQQVYYSQRFDTYYVAAEYHGGGFSSGAGGIIAIDNRGLKLFFNIPQGVTAFSLDDKTRFLATGGPDAFLRFWDAFLPTKASAILSGHHAGICYIFTQPDEKKIYTVDVAKVIKVWNSNEQSLIQTFTDLIHMAGSELSLSYMYNKADRELLVGGRKFIALKCCPKMKLDLTDGNTHAGSVSVVLYNKLFKNIVTCGFDSYIIIWNPWTGKRSLILKNCHTVKQYGDTIDMPITAACFGNPLEQLLLTGARDGSLKVWNYNIGVCIRNMHINIGCEVTAVFWVPDRILVCGWNHKVTEFADIQGEEFMSDAKSWVKLHDEDITAAAYKPGATLVTGTYSGEIILWKIGTGQPYRKYLVEKPTEFVKLVLGSGAFSNIDVDKPIKLKKTVQAGRLMRKSISHKVIEKFREKKTAPADEKIVSDIENRPIDNANCSDVQIPDTSKLSLEENYEFSDLLQNGSSENEYSNLMFRSTSSLFGRTSLKQKKNFMTLRHTIAKSGIKRRLTGPLVQNLPIEEEIVQLRLSVQSIIILWTRPESKNHGSIFVALENGSIQVYSSHQLGGYITEFNVVHKTGDCVICMTTDRKNRYLFTGTAFGYVKVWLVQNYCIPSEEKRKICMPLLRLQFIFMRNDRVLGRAKRVIRHQPEPILLNSYKAHIRSITTIEYIRRSKILITGSHDYSCRLWTLGGRYLGTLGGLVPWKEISPTQIIDEEGKFRIPPDINKVASSTTLKVLTGKYVDRIHVYIQKDNQIDMENTTVVKRKSIFQTNFGKPLTEPLLGKHFKLEITGRSLHIPVLDSSLPHIPVWEHLDISDAVHIERPPTPEVLKKAKNLEFMDYYKSDNPKKDN